MRKHLVVAAGLIVAGATISHSALAQDKHEGRGKSEQHTNDPHNNNNRNNENGDPRRQAQQQQVSQQEQQRRIGEEQRRQGDYQRALDMRMREAQAHQAQLQAERRNAQYAQQQAYYANLQAQRARMAQQRNYQNDPYYTTAHTYRYRVAGVNRQTNQYGADVLRSAVNNGYSQGVQAGRADRQDGRGANYSANFAYRDANYGYNGQYVAQSDYNYYFRQGFQRGYNDGYASTTRYGSYNNGTGSILGSLLTSILGFTTSH